MTVHVMGNIHVDRMFHVPHIAAPGETVLAPQMLQVIGGKGCNQAVAAAASGASTRLISCVGDDEDAAGALRYLASVPGLDVSAVASSTEAPTGGAFIQSARDGENAIVVLAGANAFVSREDIDRAARRAQVGDIFLAQLEMPSELVVTAMQVFKEQGCRCIVNTAPAAPLGDLAELADCIIANELEAAVLSDHSDDPCAMAHELGADVVITRGAEGAWCATEGDSTAVHVPAEHVAVVDTTGAGDAFVGAFVAALDRGSDLASAVTEGTRLASRACQSLGAQGYLQDLSPHR